MLKRRTLIEFGLAAAFIAGVGWYVKIAEEQWALGHTDAVGWSPMVWPFPPDAWPAGRAWQRDGTEVYVRLKLGICGNCDSGVATDEALERAADIDLLHQGFVPLQAGSRIRITDLFGRSRLYRRQNWYGAERFAEAIAVSYKCDLIVAIVAGDVTDGRTRKEARAFLESNTPQVWINKQLEGR